MTTRLLARSLVCCFLLSALVADSACKKAPPPDPLCKYEPLPETARAEAGQGAVVVEATTDDYFYLIDEAGKQIASSTVNKAEAAKPGRYVLRLNKSAHLVTIQAKTLTRCTAGGILVAGSTDDYYYVLDGTGTQLASSRLGHALGIFPGTYRLRLNNSPASIDVRPGSPTEIKAGLVNVSGTTDDYYYVLDGVGTQLASSKIGRAIGLFAGTYTLKVNNSDTKAEVRTGEPTELKSATLLPHGTTDEYYYVLNQTGTQLASAKLNRGLALFEGSYVLKVNNSSVPVTVKAGETAEPQTGTLVVGSPGSDYYYVLDANGTQLSSAKLGSPSALVPGSYRVKVGSQTKDVTVTAGQTATVGM